MSLGCGTVPEADYVWPIDGRVGAGHGQRLEVGDVVLADPSSETRTWWLIDGPSSQIGQNAVLVHGPVPKAFDDHRHFPRRRTHWSDDVVRDQNAIVNPPLPSWPDEVCTAVAAFKLTGEVPGGDS